MPRIVANGQTPGSGSTPIGILSLRAETTADITAVTPPAAGTKGNFDTLDFAAAGSTGQRFSFAIPDDYDSGDLTMRVVYAMSTAVAAPNNVIRVETTAEIASIVTGLVDTASYPPLEADLTVPDNSTNIQQDNLLVISEGDFVAGDVIQFFVERDGDDANDDHTGLWQVIAFELTYVGQVATRAVIQTAILRAATDEAPPVAGTKGNFDTSDFQTGVDQEQKFQLHVPENWDEASDLVLRITYAMSSAEVGKDVVIGTEGDIADVSDGTLDLLAVENFTLRVPDTTAIERSVVLRSISSGLLGRGDALMIKLARRGLLGADTHGGSLQLISAELVTNVTPNAGFTAVTISENYLYDHNFRIVSGSPDGELESPAFAGDFENYLLMTGTVAGDRIDAEFPGRLSLAQSKITNIRVPIQGTGDFQIKVFVEGSGAANVYTTSVLATAPGARTVTLITAAELSAQPTGELRYHVVVEATVDVGEVVRVGRPFVKQE